MSGRSSKTAWNDAGNSPEETEEWLGGREGIEYLRQRKPRERDEGYLNDLRSLPCILCLSNVGVEAAHVRYSVCGKPNPGVGQKPHDRYALPLCNHHHRKQHSMGEREFWRKMQLNPLHIASQLYARKGKLEAMHGFIRHLHREYENTADIPF
jgi:hypothetical protein